MHAYIVRRIDELGRVVLPKEWRDLNNIKEKDELELHIDGKALTLRKHEESCIFCGSRKKLQVYNNTRVCGKCVNSLILSNSKN